MMVAPECHGCNGLPYMIPKVGNIAVDRVPKDQPDTSVTHRGPGRSVGLQSFQEPSTDELPVYPPGGIDVAQLVHGLTEIGGLRFG